MRYGRAFILGGKYQSVVRRSRAAHKAILWQTRDRFLPDLLSLVKALAADKNTAGIEVYGLWDDNHQFSQSDIPFITEVAQKIEKVAVMTPKKKFYFAPFLEHEFKKAFMLELFRELQPKVPNLILVNNPIKQGDFLDDTRYIDEVHIGSKTGKPKKQFFVSVDGRADSPKNKKGYGNGSVDMDHAAQVESYSGALVFMDWVLQDNGKRNTKDETKRKDRKSWLTPEMDKSVCYLGQDPGAMQIKKGHLWKSHGEQNDNVNDPDNPTGNRPVYISAKEKYKSVKLKASNGKVLEEVTRSQKYVHGNGWLYRFPQWGFKYAQQANKISGSPICTIVCDGETVGVLNLAFRIPGR